MKIKSIEKNWYQDYIRIESENCIFLVREDYLIQLLIDLKQKVTR